MKARFERENPGFQDFDGLAYNPHVEKLVSGHFKYSHPRPLSKTAA